MSPILELRDADIGWDGLTVLAGFDLRLERGEVLCIVGPGRSGKSTLLRAIEAMVEGRGAAAANPWWVGSQTVTIDACARLRQHGQFHCERVRDLLEGAGLLEQRSRWQPPGADADAAVDAVLDAQLSESPDPVRRFLSFVLVAYSDAPLLLFDEPLFALSGAWADAVRTRLTQLASERRSMIIVTHYLPLARAVADRVMLVIDGVEIESAATETFFTRARHPRTRQYIEWGG